MNYEKVNQTLQSGRNLNRIELLRFNEFLLKQHNEDFGDDCDRPCGYAEYCDECFDSWNTEECCAKSYVAWYKGKYGFTPKPKEKKPDKKQLSLF